MRHILCFLLLTAGCSNSDGPFNGPSDCNNSVVECPSGYEHAFDDECDATGSVCVDSLSGECREAADCICADSCSGFVVDACTGHPDCVEHDACGVAQQCATCAEPPTCGDREVLRTDGCSDATCREVACVSDAALTYYCHASERSCTSCPTRFRECQEPSDTCIETETCGQIRLCEAV